MKKLYKYKYCHTVRHTEGASGHLLFKLMLDQGQRINEESEKRKLLKLNKQRKSEGLKPLREIERPTMIVGINKLKRMYAEGRIIGHIPPYIKNKLGLEEKRQERADKGKKRKPRRDMSGWKDNKVEPFPEPPPKMYYIWEKLD